MITALNFYYAHPGRSAEVLRQRLHASDVRERIGLARGTVIARTAGADDLPDVVWYQEFEDVAAHERDMDARAASEEFERVRAGMRKLIRRFERPLFENCGAAPRTDPEAGPIVTLDWIFCADGRTDDALGALQALADHRAARGFERGRAMRLIATGGDLPTLLWVRRYVDAAHAEREHSETASRELSCVADRIEHSTWALRCVVHAL
jgi:hypothetical protein